MFDWRRFFLPFSFSVSIEKCLKLKILAYEKFTAMNWLMYCIFYVELMEVVFCFVVVTKKNRQRCLCCMYVSLNGQKMRSLLFFFHSIQIWVFSKLPPILNMIVILTLHIEFYVICLILMSIAKVNHKSTETIFFARPLIFIIKNQMWLKFVIFTLNNCHFLDIFLNSFIPTACLLLLSFPSTFTHCVCVCVCYFSLSFTLINVIN